MFRQDRTAPSKAVSTWKGRKDVARSHPSTAVSDWLNGVGGAATPVTAFGGIITQYEDSGTTYRVHAFRGTGTFTVLAGSADVDYLIVGGAGGGGGQANANASGGGGGAGGVQQNTSGSITVDTASSPYTITVGTGGAGGSNAVGVVGVNTVALGVTADGGGYGGRASNGGAGGSGGGGGMGWSSTPTGGCASGGLGDGFA